MSEIGSFLSNRIKRERSEKGISQSAAAATLDIPLRTYQAWEKEYTSSVENLIRIGNFFQIPMSELLGPFSDVPELISGEDGESVLQGERKAVFSQLGHKMELTEKVLQGAAPEELYLWAAKEYARELPAPLSSSDPHFSKTAVAYVENCVRDVYHLKPDHFYRRTPSRDRAMEAALEEEFGLTPDSVVILKTGHVKLQLLREILLSQHGAERIIRWSRSKPGFRIGISNGFTVSKILDAIPRGSVKDLSLFPMNFTSNPVDFPISSTALISSFLYKHTGYNVTTDTLNEEQLFGAILLADAALLGIGSFSIEGLYERMIRSALGQKMVAEIRRQGIIGDLNYHLINSQGKQMDLPQVITDIGSGLEGSLVKAVGLATLRERAERGGRIIIAASGEHKREIVKVILSKGYANQLITDHTVAEGLLD